MVIDTSVQLCFQVFSKVGEQNFSYGLYNKNNKFHIIQLMPNKHGKVILEFFLAFLFN